MKKIRHPFLVVNPKSYLYGLRSLKFAESIDNIAAKSNIQIFFTCSFTDIRYIKEHTHHLIIITQHMDDLKPGRGMGHVLPESLQDAGAEAVFLNHAENSLTISHLSNSIIRARELGIISIACADSLVEATSIAKLNPDILLCEPTDLIGTGHIADNNYVLKTTSQIKSINSNISVMIASGITTAQDVYNVIKLGADGTGGTSGILKAPNPVLRVQEMVDAILKTENE
ncbi:triose-phosphate isomerase [Pectinatus frisingensis]|uniref:triose-phosphate isomerase n=1 Tax=Pectinatus frisingensis TaxID=865 RepID=UPI0018C564CD|nr:triose-phosphate isomerase [Pectinatus frisingensis]